MAAYLNLHREEFDRFPDWDPAEKRSPCADLPLMGTAGNIFLENQERKKQTAVATRREITNRLLSSMIRRSGI